MVKSEFLREATERGFVFQCTDTEALDAAFRDGIVRAYIAAPSLARRNRR